MKKAIIYGASGLVGSYILEALLDKDNYEQAVIVIKKGLGIQHSKRKTVTGLIMITLSWQQNRRKEMVQKQFYWFLPSERMLNQAYFTPGQKRETEPEQWLMPLTNSAVKSKSFIGKR